MKLEERIEAAQRALRDHLQLPPPTAEETRLVLKAFAPGLFTDPPTMWLAPMTPSAEVIVEATEAFSCQVLGTDMLDAWITVRQHYLQQESGE